MDITIITPSYNQCTFLTRTLESVLGQEGDFSLDYIVMDGGSTDASTFILRQFERELTSGKRKAACREMNFRWFSEKDRGQSHAVNKGFALAKGRLLGWLNSDDTYYDHQALSKVVSYFQLNPDAQFLYGRGIRIDEHDSFMRDEDYIINFGIQDLLEIDYILQPAAFWTKELYEAAGPLDESMHFAMDWDFWIRCSQHTELHFLSQYFACNRDYADTKTNGGAIKRKAEIARLLLKHGGFTQRSIDAYLTQRRPATMEFLKYRPPLLKRCERIILTPTRILERTIRRAIKRRMLARSNPAVAQQRDKVPSKSAA